MGKARQGRSRDVVDKVGAKAEEEVQVKARSWVTVCRRMLRL